MHLTSRSGHGATAPARPRAGRRIPRTLVALAVTAGLALSACTAPQQDEDSSSLRIGAAASTLSFSPSSSSGTDLAAPMVYDYLFTQDAEGYHPRAAESFEYNDDNTELTITLRDDLAFSDGASITADDVVASIIWSGENGAFFSAIDDVEAVDERTVRISQSRADRNVMLSLWAMPLTTQETLENPDEVAESPVSSGAYLLDTENTNSGSSYTFVRNPDYWNPEAFPYDEVTIVLLEDVTARLNALISGQVDIAPLTAVTAAEAEKSGLVISELSALNGGMIFGDRNGGLGTPIADVRVRQAINMAFDREAVVEGLYGGYAVPANQPFAVGAPGYVEDSADLYAYDPEGARELLADAGYPDGFDLSIPSYAPITADYEPYVTQALGEIGIRVTWDVYGDDTWLAAFSGGSYPIAPLGIPFSQTPDLANPDFFWNPWRNEDPQALELLDQINTGSFDEQVAATEEFGELVLEQAWTLTWAHPSVIWASTPEVQLTQPEYADWVRIGNFRPVD